MSACGVAILAARRGVCRLGSLHHIKKSTTRLEWLAYHPEAIAACRTSFRRRRFSASPPSVARPRFHNFPCPEWRPGEGMMRHAAMIPNQRHAA